ncbi:MAG: hypothetical protein ACLPKT_24015 [Methylocella sp.]
MRKGIGLRRDSEQASGQSGAFNQRLHFGEACSSLRGLEMGGVAARTGHLDGQSHAIAVVCQPDAATSSLRSLGSRLVEI